LWQDGSWHPVPKEEDEAKKKKKKEEEEKKEGEEVDLVDLSDEEGEGGARAQARATASSPVAAEDANGVSNSPSANAENHFEASGAAGTPPIAEHPGDIECIDLE